MREVFVTVCVTAAAHWSIVTAVIMMGSGEEDGGMERGYF
jgi:hypothetical protein